MFCLLGFPRCLLLCLLLGLCLLGLGGRGGRGGGVLEGLAQALVEGGARGGEEGAGREFAEEGAVEGAEGHCVFFVVGCFGWVVCGSSGCVSVVVGVGW